MSLTASGLILAHGPRTVIDGVSLNVEPGEFVAIIGPNGSGKSTLLRSLARLHPLKAGSVTLNGADIARLGSKEIARDLAILPQSPDAGLDLTVRELAWRGRYPHQGVLQRATAPDFEAVADALTAADVEDIADRVLGSLSGGERQRAWISLALAQKPRVLLLDEPTTSLDLRHQVEVMILLRRLLGEGLAVLAVLHDLHLAARYADRVVAIADGGVAFAGPPRDVFTAASLEAVFGVPMHILEDPATGDLVPIPAATVAQPAG